MPNPTWTPWKKPLSSPAPRAWALEARLMFDAAAVADAVHQLGSATDTHVLDLQARDSTVASAPERSVTVEPTAAAATHEILFIDPAVANLQSLIAGARPGVEVVLLDSQRDPWAQMTEVIGQHEDLSAVHLISHGTAGEIDLGGQRYGSTDLLARSAELQQWRNHLTADADILVYGCDVGAGATGATLIATLSQQTGADVAASTDRTGTSRLDGDWVLEASTGTIDAAIALSDTSGFDGVLAPVTTLAAPSGSATWHNVMIGSNYDPANDQQANAGQDLVGSAAAAMLQSTRDNTDPNNPVYYFRARFGDAGVNGTSFYLALDVNGDSKADVFVEAKVAANNSTSLYYHAVDPSKAGTGPSNTGWLNSANDTTQQMTALTSESYVAVGSASTDLDSNSQTDSWITFGFTLNSLKSFTPSSGISGSTGMVLYAFTSTSQTANGDIAGVNDQTANLNQTWQQLGLGISTSLDTITTTDFGTPTVSVGSVTVSEASPYAVFQISLDKASPSAISFTPTLTSGTATVGTDTGSGLEYFNGTSWVSAASGITLSGGATSVLVRTSITNDSSYEVSESFTLSTGSISGTVANPAGASGIGTIKDDGSSTNVFLAGNNSATPTVGTADDDQPFVLADQMYDPDALGVVTQTNNAATLNNLTYSAYSGGSPDPNVSVEIINSDGLLSSGADHSLVFIPTASGLTDVSFKTANGSEFKLNSFDVANLGSTTLLYIEGYRDGQLI
ncbi:MAG: hypothetical protein RLY71_2730, partial [Pseudomonadota bacterium]